MLLLFFIYKTLLGLKCSLVVGVGMSDKRTAVSQSPLDADSECFKCGEGETELEMAAVALSTPVWKYLKNAAVYCLGFNSLIARCLIAMHS